MSSFANLRSLKIECYSRYGTEEKPSGCLSQLVNEVAKLRKLRSLQLSAGYRNIPHADNIHFSDSHLQTISSMEWLEELALNYSNLSQVDLYQLRYNMPLLTRLTLCTILLFNIDRC